MLHRCPHCGKSLIQSLRPEDISIKDAERLWKTITKEPNGCWICPLVPSGIYARFGIKGRAHLAHVVSWVIHFGVVPIGKKVCHKCDTPRCIRPDHLFLGTESENMLDMVAKKRNKPRFGLANNLAKLSDDEVREIKLLLSDVPVRELASRYNVTYQSIWRIKKGFARTSI